MPAALQPDPTDKRLPFYTTTAYAAKILGFGAASTTSWPIYLPGEMTLIKAEAYARQLANPDPVNALIELNKVVTKQPLLIHLVLVQACRRLLANSAKILGQIYKNRCIELFMSGFKTGRYAGFGRPTYRKEKESFTLSVFRKR